MKLALFESTKMGGSGNNGMAWLPFMLAIAMALAKLLSAKNILAIEWGLLCNYHVFM